MFDRQPKKVLVTGATGFVGRHLLRALESESSWQIFAAGSRFAKCVPNLICFDIINRDEVSDVIKDIRPTHTIHLAGISSLSEALEDQSRAWRVNVMGSLNLIDALKVYAPGSTFVHVSTSEVYGSTFRVGRAISEEDITLPENIYSKTKLASEQVVLDTAKDKIKVFVFRAFNHTGPGQAERFVIPAFAAQIARIEHEITPPVLRVGNLDICREFLDVRDVVRAYVAAVKDSDKLQAETVLNLTSGAPRTIGSIVEELLKIARCPVEVVTDPNRLRPNELPVVWGNGKKIKDLLNWAPEIDLLETLEAIVDHWRANI